MLTRISAKKIEDSEIPGYSVRAYEVTWVTCYGSWDCVDIPDEKYCLLVYQNKKDMYDVMTEVRGLDSDYHTTRFGKEFFKNMLPKSMFDNNYAELNGVSYIKGSSGEVGAIPETNTMSLAQISNGYLWLIRNAKYVQLSKKWSSIRNLDDAIEVYGFISKVHEFKYQMSNSYDTIGNRINTLEMTISKIKSDIDNCDSDIRRLYSSYNEQIGILKSHGIDTTKFEVNDNRKETTWQ